MLYKVTIRNSDPIIIGAESNKHLEVSILHLDNYLTPEVEGRAYIFEEEQFKEFRSWDVGKLNIGDQLVIEVLESGVVSQPSLIEFSMNHRRRHTVGNKAFIKDQIEKTKRFTERLTERVNNPKSILTCSFCEKIEGEVNFIIPRFNGAICSECFGACNEIAKEFNLIQKDT